MHLCELSKSYYLFSNYSRSMNGNGGMTTGSRHVLGGDRVSSHSEGFRRRPAPQNPAQSALNTSGISQFFNVNRESL